MSERDRFVVRVRKQSLDVLGMLKQVEEQYRTVSGVGAPSPASELTLVEQVKEEDEESELTIYDESVLLESRREESELVKEWIGSVQLLLDLSDVAKRQRGRRSEGSMRDEGFSEGQKESEEEKLPSWAEEQGFESLLGTSACALLGYVLASQADNPFEILCQIERTQSFKLISLLSLTPNSPHSHSLSLRTQTPDSSSYRSCRPVPSSVNPTIKSSPLPRAPLVSSRLLRSTSSQ